MQIIRTIKTNFQPDTSTDAEKAEKFIDVSVFGDSLHITYGGLPKIELSKDTTVEEIIKQVSDIRGSYSKYLTTKNEEKCLSK